MCQYGLEEYGSSLPEIDKERDFSRVEANEALSQFKATARSDRFVTETWRSGALRYGFVHLRLSTNAANKQRCIYRARAMMVSRVERRRRFIGSVQKKIMLT